MNQLLGRSPEQRRQIFEQTAARMNLAEVGVEKDFWVCWTLDKLFRLPLGQHLTFKGGTSLSKAWHLIERLSEDIDITIHRDALGFGGENAPHKAPSKNQRKKRLEALKAACEEYIAKTLLTELKAVIATDLTDRESWSLQLDEEDSQTLLFTYPSLLSPQATYISRLVKIEMGGRADVEPAEMVTIRPYVAETFPEVLPETQVTVRAILPVRTFWEKAMLLHEENFRPEGKTRKTGMARHYYDLYKMIKEGVSDEAAADLELFNQIANQRELYFQYGWVDYETHKQGRLQITPIKEQLPDWRADYRNMQTEMFFGEIPEFEDIIAEVQRFQDRFNDVAS